MEQMNKCSGICSQIDRFIFTDINRGAPINSCGEHMQLEQVRELEDWRLISIALMIVSLIVTMMFALLIKLHPDINDILE